MSNHYYYAAGPNPRPTYTHNPATTSMPTSIGYSSMYAGDMHVLPSSSSSSQQRHMTQPRGYYHSTTSQGVPTTTRTFAVNHGDSSSRSRPSIPPLPPRESSRTRRSTLDSAPRPPVIVTTSSHKDRPAPSSSSHSSHHDSTPRESRTNDLAYGKAYYDQSSPNSRSRHHTRRYSGSEDYGRRDRESSLSRRDDGYRSSRPAVYQDPRHSSAAVDYTGGEMGADGFQYTNAGELAKYDLDNPKASRRRRDSVDRGYHRPSLSYGGANSGGEQAVMTVSATPEPSRPYSSMGGRTYDGRGPPPSTRGFDRINNYSDARPAPAPAPVSPSPTQSSHFEVAEGAGRRGRPRPLSLYQENPSRSAHHDEYYRSRDEDRHMRQVRDRDANVPLASPSFYDQSVTSRGFGIRTAPGEVPDITREQRRDESARRHRRDESERRRRDESAQRRGKRDESERRRRDESAQRHGRRDESAHRPHGRRDESERRRRRDESINRSDESIKRDSDNERREHRHHKRVSSVDPRLERPPSRKGSDDEQQKERTRLRDKVTGGLGIAAAAMGLAPLAKSENKEEPKEKDEPRRRRSPSDEKERGSKDVPPSRAEREWEKERERKDSEERKLVDVAEPKEEAKPLALPSTSEDDGNRSFKRRHRPSHGFDPNDAGDLSKLKEQLAAMKTSDRDREREPVEAPPKADKGKEKEHQATVEDVKDETTTKRTRSNSPKDVAIAESPNGDSSPRGRASQAPTRSSSTAPDSTKQVRLVSPPRTAPTATVKGILKQPSARFPEDANPVREGVAPHKEDKKLKEVPPGARWTKISRSKVNPEALEYGKERYEVRDDFVIVLRVLSKEEIQAYAHATQILRERRRNPEKAKELQAKLEAAEKSATDEDEEKEKEKDKESRKERHHQSSRTSDEERERRERRHRRREEEEGGRYARREDDEGRYNKRDEQDEEDGHHHHHHHHGREQHGGHHGRSFRERERERQGTI